MRPCGRTEQRKLACRDMVELLGLDSLFAQMITGIGLALVVGNGYAWYRHSRGRDPEDAEGPFRTGRVVFLIGVGIVMTAWGVASLIT